LGLFVSILVAWACRIERNTFLSGRFENDYLGTGDISYVYVYRLGSFYKAIVQSVLLYGSETWVISAANMRKLASFHPHGCARFISNRHIQPDDEGTWTYPSNESVLEDAGFPQWKLTFNGDEIRFLTL
jgi:hypothetical protein